MFKSIIGLAATLLIVGVADAKEYKDPGGAFVIDAPEGWEVSRENAGGVGTQTTLTTDKDDAITIEIVAMKGDRELDEKALELGKTLVEQMLADLKEDGAKFKSKEVTKVKFAGRDAIRADAVFVEDGDDEVQQGAMIAVAGKRHLLLITISGPKSNAKDFKKAEEALATLAVEGVKGSGTEKPKGGGLMNAKRLQAAAAAIKGNLKETPADTVLVAGDPALTYAAVRDYIATIEQVFDMELTEVELQMAREKCIELFNEGDPDSKRLLTVLGAKVLEHLNTGTEAEKAAKKKDLREGMTKTFAAQSKQGNTWAVTMSEAIARRSSQVAKVDEEKPKPKFAEEGKLKTQLTEADLDASLEMLYFMWVASGRPQEQATPEAIAAIRQAIATNFAKMDPRAQYLFANAEQIYALMRSNWAVASEEDRAAYRRQFASALDEMGLTVEQRSTGSAWDDVAGKDSGTLRAELVQVTCWNLAQKNK